MKHAILLTLLSLFTTAALAQASVELTTNTSNPEQIKLVADSFERTLYVFDPDMGQAVPQCAGDCAERWPPYTLTPAEVASLKAPLGAIVRANGMSQLTIDGRPVYTFFQDRIAGDDLGEGLGGVWHAVKAN